MGDLRSGPVARSGDRATTGNKGRQHYLPLTTLHSPGEPSMSSALPKLYLARHGDTAWTDSHQHTGRTDLPLNERGEEHALQLGERLRGFSFARVFTSPLQRTSRT